MNIVIFVHDMRLKVNDYSDVGQIKAQVLILDGAEAAHCRSPFNA